VPDAGARRPVMPAKAGIHDSRADRRLRPPARAWRAASAAARWRWCSEADSAAGRTGLTRPLVCIRGVPNRCALLGRRHGAAAL